MPRHSTNADLARLKILYEGPFYYELNFGRNYHYVKRFPPVPHVFIYSKQKQLCKQALVDVFQDLQAPPRDWDELFDIELESMLKDGKRIRYNCRQIKRTHTHYTHVSRILVRYNSQIKRLIITYDKSTMFNHKIINLDDLHKQYIISHEKGMQVRHLLRKWTKQTYGESKPALERALSLRIFSYICVGSVSAQLIHILKQAQKDVYEGLKQPHVESDSSDYDSYDSYDSYDYDDD